MTPQHWHNYRVALAIVALPAAGAIASMIALTRNPGPLIALLATVCLLLLFGTGLLLAAALRQRSRDNPAGQTER